MEQAVMVYGIIHGLQKIEEAYLADEEKVLKAKAGSKEKVQPVNVDTENRITVPASLEHADVTIRGCISTIELAFTPQRP